MSKIFQTVKKVTTEIGDLSELLAAVTLERSLDNGGSWVSLGTVSGTLNDLSAGRSFAPSPPPPRAQAGAVRFRVSVTVEDNS
jgi:hypothetical protein